MVVEQQNKMRTQEKISFLIDRDGDFCHSPFCPNPYDWDINDKKFRTVEHIIPTSRGGLDVPENWALYCFACNNKKSNRIFLDDGTLEPLPYKEPKNKVEKRPPTECCNEGRNLGEDEICEICGSGPQPYSFPRTKQRHFKDCDHNIYHCKFCVIGVYERKPASEGVFGE